VIHVGRCSRKTAKTKIHHVYSKVLSKMRFNRHFLGIRTAATVVSLAMQKLRLPRRIHSRRRKTRTETSRKMEKKTRFMIKARWKLIVYSESARYFRLNGLIITPGFKSAVKVWLSVINSASSASCILTNWAKSEYFL